MPESQDPEGLDDAPGPKLGLWHRMLLALPTAKRREEREQRASLGERISSAVLKPPNPDAPTDAPDKPETVEELEDAVRYANDMERLIGLVAAPLAAALSLVLVSALIANNPAATLKSGAPNPAHNSVSVYHELGLVLLGMALLLMVAAWFRKRLFMGILLALYGLAIFNLHYWGFGIPFILAGAWYLVKAYRLQRELKLATAGGPRSTPRSNGRGPTPSKRYTPPTPTKRRNPQKPEDKRQAG
jgi:hypothetical protein